VTETTAVESSESPKPRVSVVIPSFNRRDSLAGVIAALKRQTYPADHFEIVVVLDGSDDGSRELLESEELRGSPGLRVLWQPNQGAGRARNKGARAANGELLIFLDDDVVARPDLIEKHVEAHQVRPGDVVLGRLDFRSLGPASVVTNWEAEWYERHFAEMAQPNYAFACWDFFAGNISIARSDFLEAGGFDEVFTNYGCEDWELGLRLLKAGHRFRFCGDAVGEHRYTVDFAGWLKHGYWDGRSEVRFVQRHPEIKHALQIGQHYHGSLKRRLGRRLFQLAPFAWAMLSARLAPVYLLAERARQRWLAARLAKLLWTYQHWSGLRDELRGADAADQFVGFQVPILAYHRVTDRPEPALAEFAVSPRTFRRQLAWLRSSGHHVVSLSDVYDAYRGGSVLPRKPVAITFDDGYEDTGTVAAPILREFGYPATVFVVGKRVGGCNQWDADLSPTPTRLMDWQLLCGLASQGVEIGGHSATHAHLPDLSDARLAGELRDSRSEIEREMARTVRWLAYPYGDHDERVRAASRDAGYLAAFTFDGGLAGACDDIFQLPRIPVGESDGVVGLASKLALGEDWWTAMKRRAPTRLKTAGRKLLGRTA
jgi:peptidoglycan/xylan/chitin deacetylase (PgdA/CDA1 family)/GT2 family glycosyltransferase